MSFYLQYSYQHAFGTKVSEFPFPIFSPDAGVASKKGIVSKVITNGVLKPFFSTTALFQRF